MIQLFSLIVGGISCMALAFLDSFSALCAGMFVTSFLLDMLRPAMSSAISVFSKPESLTRSYSLNRMAVNLGAGIGPAVAGILAGISFRLIFIGDGLTSVLAGIAVYFYFHHKIKEENRNRKVKNSDKATSPFSNKYLLLFLLLCVTYAIVFFQLFCTLPLYYEHIYHLEKSKIGYLLAMNGIIVFLFEMILVFRLENAHHPARIIISGILLSIIALVMLNFFHERWVLVVSMVLLSFSEILAMPFMATVVVSSADHTNRGAVTGLYSVAWSAAFILAPLIGTGVVTQYGFDTLWWLMAALGILTMAGMFVVVPRLLQKNNSSKVYH